MYLEMKLLKLIPIFSLLILASCGPSCDDVICPAGQECLDGTCITAQVTDPCEGVACESGFSCVNGDCVEDGTVTPDPVTVSGTLSANAIWTNDRFYILSGKVVVPSGVTLTINPGTIIKGAEGAETLASALVVARGGKLIAEGTSTQPIIFTSVLDNIELGASSGTNLNMTDNEKWGGILVLGYAPISASDGDAEANIEGIPVQDGTGKYGGNDPADNSGILKYISIRHGGITIGDGNEINGLTLGGVGNGTVIENIEVAANLDDGIEFFGGTVDVKNAVVAYQGDDAIDIDQNYSGTVDNFAIVHGGADTDEALEIDGPEGSANDGLFTLVNGTCIAVDTDKTSGADLKSKAQGLIDNVVWKGYTKLVAIRAKFNDDCSLGSDAYTNVPTGALIITNSEVVGTFAATDVATITYDSKAENAETQAQCLEDQRSTLEAVVDDMIATNGNAIVTEQGTSGADMTAFEWTWAHSKGLLQ